jgi:hypothetical protein
MIPLLLAALNANAALITYTGSVDPTARGTWNVSMIRGSFDALSSSLENQAWWGNGALALEFAALTSDRLGFPNDSGKAGPIFAWAVDYSAISPVQAKAWLRPFDTAAGIGVSNTDVLSWAIASRVPEPAAFYLLAAGLFVVGMFRRGSIA